MKISNETTTESWIQLDKLITQLNSGGATADVAYQYLTHKHVFCQGPVAAAAIEILYRAATRDPLREAVLRQAAEAPQFRPLSEMPDEYRDGREVLLRLPISDPESNTVEWIVARWQEVFVNSGELESLWVSAIDDHDCFGDYAATGWSPILSMRPEEVDRER